MKRPRILQALSILLTAALLSQVPVAAFAEEPSRPLAPEEIVVTAPEFPDEAQNNAHIITELPDRRDAYTKQFFRSDGTIQAVQYALPVHFEAPDGSWQQYDNRMTETMDVLDAEAAEAAAVQTVAAADDAQQVEYRVIRSDSDIRLAQKAGNKKIVTIARSGHRISWGFSGVNRVPVEFSAPEDPGTGDDAFLNLQGIVQEAWYRGAFENVDLQYLVLPVGVKENLILKNADAPAEYTIEYKFQQLTAVQTDEKTIELRSGNTVVYTIAAPAMQDANGVWSNALTLQIVEAKNNKLKVKLIADRAWLQSADRAYPVTVDPSFETSQSWGTVDSTTLESGHPSTAHGQGSAGYIGSLYVGYEPNSSFKKTRALVRLNNLPQLSPGDMVVNAQLQLLQYAANAAIQVNAHKVTADWAMATATWNSASGQYDSTVADYDMTTSGVTTVYNTWDITRMTREWYSAPSSNHGVMLIAPSETSTSMSRVIYYASTYPSTVTVRPVFALTYRNNKGLESYWTYHEQTLENGTVGAVNDYSGNLVVQVPILSESGNRMPISLNLTYNGYTAHRPYLNGNSGLTAGNGWQMNWSQRCYRVEQLPGLGSDVVAALQAAGFKRIYIDEDGTVHYFKTTTDDYTLEDEDGLGMTMRINSNPSSPYLIECSDGSKLHFTAYGYIYKIEDANGNIATVNYSGSTITALNDGVGRVTTLASETSGSVRRLTSVTDPTGRTVTLNYNGNNLQSVTYADGTSVQFVYESVTINGSSYSLLTRATDRDGSYVSYEYQTNGADGQKARVTAIRETGADGTSGNRVDIAYGVNNTTHFAYTCGDKTSGETYQFDNCGRTKAIRNDDGSFAQAAYHPDAGRTGNRITQSSSGEQYVNNLLLDTSAEKSTSQWTASDSAASFAIDTAQYFLGYKSLKVSASADGADHGYFQSASVTAGQSYTFSAYMRTSDVAASDTNGAGLYATFYNGSTALSTVRAAGVTGTNEWQRVKLTFTAPSGATSVRVYCGLMSASGTAWFDCMQLESGRTMNGYNMIESSSFERLGSWTGKGMASGDGTNTANGWFRLTGGASANRAGHQTVQVNRTHTSFTISAKATGQSVPTGYDGRYYAVDLGVYYENGTSSWHLAHFNPDTSDQQRASLTVLIPESKKDLKIKYVVYYLIYYKNANTVYFDDCMMTFDETSTAYTYDAKGNVISAKDNANRNSTYSYNSADELTQNTNERNESYAYTYAAANPHQVIAARSKQLGNGFTYTYDSHGTVTGTKMGTVSDSGILDTNAPYLQSETGLSTNGNYVIQETDQRGNTTYYDISALSGLTNRMTDPNGNVTDYTYAYNSWLLTEMISGGRSIQYTYDANQRLSGIQHNGFTYGFTYDAFGNRSTIRVGSRTLSSFTYAPNNGYLQRTTYGNGAYYDYAYDNQGRVTQRRLNGNLLTEILYNAKGAIAEQNDLAIGRKTVYTYDESGRLLRTLQPGYSDISTSYDVMNRVTGMQYRFAGQQQNASFAYGADGRKGNATLLNGAQRTTTYDSLNRETAASIGALSRAISYVNVSGNRTTTLPASVIYTGNGNTLLNVSYTYDAVGNISTMVQDGVTYTYTYDSLNQLTAVATSDNSYTAAFSYDNGGNLTSKTVNGQTYTYSYGDTEWKDLLTAYNGESITYDQIGNPLSYRGKTLTWTGRRLDSLTQNGSTNTYLYNADGIRTQKTVNGTTTEYFLNGSAILAEKTGNNIIWYIYDSDGTILGFAYNGTAYYYVKNMQDDVLAIVDASNNVVGSYTYDAWGKVLSATGEIAQINPIRYRSYYYDAETGLYYLNSRYYDPEIGRFVNADNQLAGVGGEICGYNMFAYGLNNPVNMSDKSGAWPKWATVALGVVAAVAAVALTVATLGAAAPAAICTMTAIGMKVGLSCAVAYTAATVTAVAVTAVAATYAADIAYSSITGDSPLLKTVFRGNVGAYNTGLMVASVATSGMLELAAQSPGVCFVAGTPVLAACGYVSIEEIKVGDMVWSKNADNGEMALKVVRQTYVRETSELVHLSVGEERITTTPEHPFYVPQKGWTAASQLRAGDILVRHDGQYVVVEKVQHEILEAPITVYNFEVADFHTYYVGYGSVLVHNTCGPKKQATYSTRKQAFNAAKREIGVPRSQQPTVLPNIGNRGEINPGRVYDFGNGRYIRDDVVGHTFQDGTHIGPHFNTPNGLHIFYE